MYYRVAEDKKAGVQDNRVAEAVKEMIQLQSAMQEHFGAKLLETIPEYKVFQRVLEEQTRLDDQGERVPKDKKDISPDSVQNPFDATVTYRYKRGQHHGHVLNAAEAVDDSGNGIIVHATVEPNTASDSAMAKSIWSSSQTMVQSRFSLRTAHITKYQKYQLTTAKKALAA